MRDIFKKIFLILILISILAIILSRLLSLWSFPDSKWILKKDDKITMEVGKDIVQKFKAEKNGLSEIQVLLGSIKNQKDGKIRLNLYEENCNELIRESELNFISLSSDYPYSFKFPRIYDSRDKTYCLIMTAQFVQIQTKKPSVFITDNFMPENEYLFNSATNLEFKNQALSMRPAYKNDNFWQNVTELNQRISQYKPWYFKYCLNLVEILFILFSLSVIVLLIFIEL